MSLPQLIGLQCVACQKNIASVLEATFCADCGNPVHRKCSGSVKVESDDRCPNCGGDPDSALAVEVQREREEQARSAETAAKAALPPEPAVPAFPVGETCPGCGSTSFTRVPPERWVAFAKDRICNGCGMRYTPPTPVWAAIIFLVLGAVFILGSVGNLLFAVSPRISPSIFGLLLGVAALSLGYRSLNRPGKV